MGTIFVLEIAFQEVEANDHITNFWRGINQNQFLGMLWRAELKMIPFVDPLAVTEHFPMLCIAGHLYLLRLPLQMVTAAAICWILTMRWALYMVFYSVYMSWASTIIYILQIETLNNFVSEHRASKHQLWEPILYLTPAAPLCYQPLFNPTVYFLCLLNQKRYICLLFDFPQKDFYQLFFMTLN